MPETYLFGLRKRWWVLLVVLVGIITTYALLAAMANSRSVTEFAQEATRTAAGNAQVIDRLGNDVAMSGQHSAKVASDRGVRRMSAVIPVAGARGSGTLYATGVVDGDGNAKIASLTLAAGNERIEVPLE